jgi:hypothetical protein
LVPGLGFRVPGLKVSIVIELNPAISAPSSMLHANANFTPTTTSIILKDVKIPFQVAWR